MKPEKDSKSKDKEIKEEEDATCYDEFIPSYNSWLSARFQKERAKHLEEKIED